VARTMIIASGHIGPHRATSSWLSIYVVYAFGWVTEYLWSLPDRLRL